MASTTLRRKPAVNRGISPRQLLFVDEYLLSLSPTAAAKKAGYKHPDVAGFKVLKCPVVARLIAKAKKETAERFKVTRDKVIEKLGQIVLRDPADLCGEDGSIRTDNIRALPKAVRATIDSIKQKVVIDKKGNRHVTTELKLAPITPAIELVMRHFGMLTDHIETEQRIGIDWAGMTVPSADPSNVIDGDYVKRLAAEPPENTG